MQTVVDIEAIEKRFGEVQAVAGVSLRVHAGEIVGLIGPDGAGKTTTMRVVAGLMAPDAGRVQIMGHDLAHAARAVRPLVGYMPQHYSLYGDLSVQENLRFFAGMYGVRKGDLLARESRLLGIARLEEFRSRPAAALSGGMYKKLALSCALVHAPRVLLLDEPTNGIDPISRRELWALLQELVGEGVGVLMTTPTMDEAQRCHRVGLLVDGRLVADDAPKALEARFDATVLEVSTAKPLGTTAPLVAVDGVEEAYTVGRKVHVVTRRGPSFAARLDEVLRTAGAEPTSIRPVVPSFEDIFMHLSSSSGPPRRSP